MGYLHRASLMLKATLLKIYNAEKPLEIDQLFYEFGSIQYHVKCSVSDPNFVYLSTSTSLEAQGTAECKEISLHTNEVIKGIAMGVIDIVEPPKLGFQLTLRLNFDRMPRGKGGMKIISRICEIEAIILSSKMKVMLRNVSVDDDFQVINKPIKIVFHPTEPFYVFKKPHKITAVYPMRFKDHTDVVIATSFFHELVEVGNEKAPECNWSPIPPPELRGEPLHELSTNGGFVSFDITSRHIEGKRLDNTVWNLLNFYAYVKYHVKCSRGFIQRRMRRRMESLVEVLHNTSLKEDEQREKRRKLAKIPKAKVVKQRCKEMTTRIKRSKFRIKINGCVRFRFYQRLISTPKFSSNSRPSYTRLE